MYVRVKNDRDRDLKRVLIVAGVRENGKVKQKTLRYVGSAQDDAAVEDLKHLAQVTVEQWRQASSRQTELLTPAQHAELKRQFQSSRKPKPTARVLLKDCVEKGHVVVGIRQAFGEVYRLLGWEKLLGPKRLSSNRIIQELVLARLFQPKSKMATVEQLAAEAGVSLNLERVYKSMDYLNDDVISRICSDSWDQAQLLLPQPVRVVFYDLSTLYFESEQSDELRANGYSKDGKAQKVQVLLALLLTEHGLPVGYEVFPGNTFEGNTLETMLDKLGAQSSIESVTFVADSAMLSRKNQALLQQKGLSYIVGFRLKSTNRELKEKILDESRYTTWKIATDEEHEALARYQEIRHEQHRIIVTYSPKRARKDEKLREKALEKLSRRIGKNTDVSTLLQGASGKYLTVSGDSQVVIDEQKIKDQARWDGLRAITVYGNDTMSASELVGQYKQLWQIEHGFRTNKHDLRMRPIYHWSPSRVKAHIAICYMAYCCAAHLRYRLMVLEKSQSLEKTMSLEKIRRELSRLRFTILDHKKTNRQYAMPSSGSVDARTILRAVGLKWSTQPFLLDEPL